MAALRPRQHTHSLTYRGGQAPTSQPCVPTPSTLLLDGALPLRVRSDDGARPQSPPAVDLAVFPGPRGGGLLAPSPPLRGGAPRPYGRLKVRRPGPPCFGPRNCAKPRRWRRVTAKGNCCRCGPPAMVVARRSRGLRQFPLARGNSWGVGTPGRSWGRTRLACGGVVTARRLVVLCRPRRLVGRRTWSGGTGGRAS